MAARQRNPYRDPRADDLRPRYHGLYGADERPVPVEIAGYLLGPDWARRTSSR